MSAARARRRAGGPSPATLAVLALAVVVAVAVVVADALGGAPAPEVAEAGAAREVTAGTTTCPVAVADDEQATIVVASAGAASSVEVDGGAQGSYELDADERVTLTADESGPVTVAWRGGPVAATWYVEGSRDAAGPCQADPAPTYWLAGLDTSLGGGAQLHLANPYGIDAVVGVSFGTAEGPVDLVRTENVVVPAGGREELDLVDLQPEEPELGVTVETLAGRVHVQAEAERERFEDEDTGVQGRALIPAVTEPATTWHFASAIDNEEWDSALAVYNPSEREAAVVVRPTDPAGDTVGRETSVPAGGVTRIDLADVSEEAVFSLVVQSANDVPVVVARVETTPEAERTGYAVSPGIAEPSTSWLLPGVVGTRADLVAVHNPTGDSVRVTARGQGEILEGWQGRVLSPNERAFVESPSFPVRLEADGGVVVEQVSTLEDGADLGRVVGLATDLVPDVRSEPPPIALDDGLRTRSILPAPDEAGDLGLDEDAAQ